MAALPRPSSYLIPQPLITQPISPHQTGAVPHTDLFGRQVTLTPATCGYYDGVAASPVTCDTNTGYECGYLPDATAPNFGCCSTAEGGTKCELGYVSICIDNGANGNDFDGVGVMVDPGNKLFLCGTDIPYCSTLVLYGTSDTSYYSYACQAGSRTTATAYMTADTTSASSLSSSSAAADSSTTVASREPASITRSATAQSPSPTEPGGRRLASGAKIGIGVGVGVGALVLVAAVIAFFLWKRRSSNQRKADQIPGYQYQSAPNTQEMEPAPWSGHDVYGRYKPAGGGYADGSPEMYASELGEREPVELSGSRPER